MEQLDLAEVMPILKRFSDKSNSRSMQAIRSSVSICARERCRSLCVNGMWKWKKTRNIRPILICWFKILTVLCHTRTAKIWKDWKSHYKIEKYVVLDKNNQIRAKFAKWLQWIVKWNRMERKKKEVERMNFKMVHKNNWYNEGMKGMVTVWTRSWKCLRISTSKLTKGFSSLFGTSVHAYVIDQRLEKAASLLLESNLNVSQVAILVGYSKASNFAAAFKRKYGVNPKNYKAEATIG